jgi:DNA ligase (NAD+)
MLRSHLELQLLVKELFLRPREVGSVVANETLRQIKYYYYETTNPVIPDEEYDRLETSLKTIWPDLAVYNEVGSKVKQQDIKLPYLLGSLNKTYSSDLSWFKGRKEFVISEKLDGLSFYAEFQDGEVKMAATRGDGKIGSEITHKAKVFCRGIKVKTFKKICIRGEITMVGDSYKKYEYKNRRNGIVGLLKNDAYSGTEDMVVKFYEIIESPWILKTEKERFEKLQELGFPTPKWAHVIISDVEEKFSLNGKTIKIPFKKFVDEMEDFLKNKKDTIDYDMDGFVIADNNCQREDVPYPKNKIAFKCNASGKITTVEKVVWNVSRTGKIVPLVNVDPVDLQGAEIRNAAGFNAEYIEKNGVYPGVQVKIVRSGDVIPYIQEVIHAGLRIPKVDLPSKCPSCGSTLIRKGVDLWCLSDDCEAQNEKRIEHFLRSLGVEEMSLPTIRKLGFKKIYDAYVFDSNKAKTVAGMGEKSITTIVNQIKKTLGATAAQLFSAFGISNCGVKTCETILENYEFDQIFSLRKEDLTRIQGIGETIAQNIVEELPVWKPVCEFLLSKGLTLKKQEKIIGKLSGKSFLITGTLSMKRKDVENLIKSKGGIIASGVNKELNYLIVGDNPGSKLDKAKKLNIPIISEDELKKMF